ncbi:MAG: glycosyltransferase [Chitinophagales bacterium]|nr:glycosyltransferase [Chitinophagales bacterium]
MLNQFLLIAFLCCTFVQIAYWLFIFSRLAFYKNPPIPQVLPEPVSIIICAKNEAENLLENLPYFLNQDYVEFEVIVVNDNSSDKTLEILLDFQKKSPRLRVINVIVNTPIGKKAALAKGIAAAQFEILLLSDADCRPSSSMWVEHTQAFIRDGVEIGLGYSPYLYRRGEGILLNAFIRFETVYTAYQYFSSALMGLPYMGVGRNLAYRKNLFYQAGGFDSHMDVASGDDDLFINQVATPKNTRVILSPTAFVYSKPKSSWRGYYRQKSRHLATGTRYRTVHQWALGLLSFSHFGHYVFGFALILFQDFLTVVFINYLARIAVVSFMYSRTLRKLRDHSLAPWVPLLDVLYVGFYLVFAPAILKKTEKWN